MTNTYHNIVENRTDFASSPAIIKVIGVGGAGGNAVNRMVSSGLKGVEFIALNTDAQVLRSSLASVRVQLGKECLKGLGSGGDPEKGRQAAEESKDRIIEVLKGADMIFITAGMGGGTGTGASPLIAEAAKNLGILTIGVVTMPFEYEQHVRIQQALEGIAELKKHLDTLITIPNDKVFKIIDEKTPYDKAFALIDDVLRQSVQAVSDIITKPGFINRDFNDVKRILKNAGEALIGMGEAAGEERALAATRKAMENPLLENVTIQGARKILVNITAAHGMFMKEIHEVMDLVKDAAGPDSDIAYGAVEDEDMEERMKVTILASALPEKSRKAQKPSLLASSRPSSFISGTKSALGGGGGGISSSGGKTTSPEEILNPPIIPPDDDKPAYLTWRKKFK